MSTWVETTSERARRPSSTTAAAVSSHEVSRPSTSIGRTWRLACVAPARYLRAEHLHHVPDFAGPAVIRRELQVAAVGLERRGVLAAELLCRPEEEPRPRSLGVRANHLAQQCRGLGVAAGGATRVDVGAPQPLFRIERARLHPERLAVLRRRQGKVPVLRGPCT